MYELYVKLLITPRKKKKSHRYQMYLVCFTYIHHFLINTQF